MEFVLVFIYVIIMQDTYLHDTISRGNILRKAVYSETFESLLKSDFSER